jgi:hypothetical protein
MERKVERERVEKQKIDYLRSFLSLLKKMLTSINEYLLKRKLYRSIKNKKCDLNNLNGVDLSYMNLSSIDIRGAKLKNSILVGTRMKNIILQGGMLNNAKLSGADLRGANLKYVDFSGADLRGADLCEANLHNAIFTRADLRGVNLSGAKLDNTTNFMEANMVDIIIDEKRFNITINNGATIKQMSFYGKLRYKIGYRKHLSMNSRKIMPIVPTTK